MKLVRISEEAHTKLIAYAAYLTLEFKKQISLGEAVSYLLDDASAKFYKKKALETEQ